MMDCLVSYGKLSCPVYRNTWRPFLFLEKLNGPAYRKFWRPFLSQEKIFWPAYRKFWRYFMTQEIMYCPIYRKSWWTIQCLTRNWTIQYTENLDGLSCFWRNRTIQCLARNWLFSTQKILSTFPVSGESGLSSIQKILMDHSVSHNKLPSAQKILMDCTVSHEKLNCPVYRKFWRPFLFLENLGYPAHRKSWWTVQCLTRN